MENLLNTHVKVSKENNNQCITQSTSQIIVILTLTLIFAHVKGLKAERETEESHIFLFIVEIRRQTEDRLASIL